MTDTASSLPAQRRRLSDDQLAIVIGSAILIVLAVGALLYFTTRSSDSGVVSTIKGEVQGQFRTSDVSCRGIGFTMPNVTKQKIYACDVKNVADGDRPNGHIHDNVFTRCYVEAVNTQIVDVSHAASIEAKLRHESVPCR